MNTKYIYRVGMVAVTATLLWSSLSSVALAQAPDRVVERKESMQERKEMAQTRLQDAKLRACQAREKAIKNRLESLIRMTQNMQGKFSAIAGRVQDYYTATVVPSGKTVANYDALVADITAKNSAVQIALMKAQSDVATFTCTGEDPKGNMGKFNENMRAVKQALKDYRTSIKNLIVAVRSVTGENQ